MLGQTIDGDPLTCDECLICLQTVKNIGFAKDIDGAKRAILARLTCPQCSRHMPPGRDCACGVKSMLECQCKKCNGGVPGDHKTWNVSLPHAIAQ